MPKIKTFDEMRIFNVLLTIFLLALIGGCAAGKKTARPSEPPRTDDRSRKAYNHFLEGALFDFQDQYDRALIEYYQALLYDSSSAQILKAIARDLMRLQYYESAIITLKQAHKKNPEDLEILNYLGEAYYNLKDFQQSVKYFELLLDKDPYNTAIQNNLVYLYTQLGMSDRLLNYYRKMMQAYPGDTGRALQYAMECLKQKKLEPAREVLTKVVQSDSTQLQALYLLGNLQELQKDSTAAIQTYSAILQKNPQNSKALDRLYRIFRSSRDWEKIEKTYLPLVEQDSTNTQVRLILAEAYYAQKKYDQAKAVLEPVLRDEQFRPAALELLGRISYEEENYAEAESYFSMLTEENARNRYGWLFLTIVYNQQKQYQKSISLLQRALSIHSQDADLLEIYGNTLDVVGRSAEAVEPLEKALQLEPDNLSFLASLAAVYDKLKMWDKSDSLYIAALEKYPDNALLLNNYSYSLSVRGIELEKALNLVNRALEIDPDNGAYLDTKGWIYFQMGQYQEALYYIQKALESREESAEVIEHLGDVYMKLGNTQEARECWQKALEKDPDNENLKEKLKVQ
ncbi:MAG: tetratricopeptide repeat protein [Calditrichia bacterium]